MAVNSTLQVVQEQESHTVHSIVVLPDGGTTNPSYISHQNVPGLTKSDLGSTADTNLLTASNPMDKSSNHAPGVLDIDLEKGNGEVHVSKQEYIGNLKSDDSLAEFQREICLQIGGRFMQLLMNHGPEWPKFASRDKTIPERVYDTSMNRSRKYKRSPSFKSFNSRRVVFLFSVLSSLGTIILIYLTLRVRQIADGSSNV